MKNILNILGKFAVIIIFALAIYLLYHKLKAYSLNEIKHAVNAISPRALLLSLCLMVVNFIVLMGYDWLALKAIKKKLQIVRVFLVSFVGAVISLNFGALLGGSTVRYRLYSAWGFSPIDIIRLVLMLAVTFWVGAMGLAGALFMFVPLEFPEELGINLVSVKPLGVLLFGLCIFYHIICWRLKGRSFHVFKKEFALPPLHIAIAQTIVSGLDLIVAAACLFVLLPPVEGLPFIDFLPNYLLAQVAVVLTHVPGGVGVLEVIIVNLTHQIPVSVVFASILIFRVIYYIIPLLFASVLLAVNEVCLQVSRKNQDEGRLALNDWLLSIFKYVTFIVGIFLCLSVVFPFKHTATLFCPYELAIFAYWLRGVVGVVLIVFAYGLDRKQKGHWYIIVVSLLVGLICVNLTGGGIVENAILLVLLIPLVMSHKKFTRERIPVASHYPLSWFISSITVICAMLLLGYFLISLHGYKSLWLDILGGTGPFIQYLALIIQLFTGIAIFILLNVFDRIWKQKRGY